MQFDRIKKIIGNNNFDTIQNLKVIILGVGGVGGYTLDCLYRSGISNITIIDYDSFDITNQNRQIGATNENIGKLKTQVLKQLYPNILTINQKLTVDYINNFDFTKYDIIIDAIDDIDVKVALITQYYHKTISSLGSAKRLDPSFIKYINIFKTINDPFAKKLRYKLKQKGFNKSYKVVYSDELPKCKSMGSFVGVTGSFGLKICSLVIEKFINQTNLE